MSHPSVRQSPTRLNYVSLEAVARRAANRLGVGAGTVGQWMKPAARDCVFAKARVICEELIAAGHRRAAESRCAPLFALFSSMPTPALTDDLLIQEVDLDAEMARLRERFALNRNYANRMALAKSLHRHESCEHMLCLALDGMGTQ